MGAPGVNPQIPGKQSMVNSLPPFPADIKNASVTSVPNMVSRPCLRAVGLQWVMSDGTAARVLASTLSGSVIFCDELPTRGPVKPMGPGLPSWREFVSVSPLCFAPESPS